MFKRCKALFLAAMWSSHPEGGGGLRPDVHRAESTRDAVFERYVHGLFRWVQIRMSCDRGGLGPSGVRFVFWAKSGVRRQRVSCLVRMITSLSRDELQKNETKQNRLCTCFCPITYNRRSTRRRPSTAGGENGATVLANPYRLYQQRFTFHRNGTAGRLPATCRKTAVFITTTDCKRYSAGFSAQFYVTRTFAPVVQ